jgi:3D (Asp-Asp-Asp) domain-containing protein
MKRQTAIGVLTGAALGVWVGGAPAHADPDTASPAPAKAIDLAATPRALTSTAPPPSAEEQPGEQPAAGKAMGRFKLTYYWLPAESGGPRKVQLYNKYCRPVARVSRAFERRLRLEGGGKLHDGRVLTYSGRCGCSHSPCFRVARRGHSWGTGVHERPLSPFRSVAVDPRRVPIGRSLYIPELDGMAMPGRPPWGGFVHDGCVVADDQGGGVRGRQLDLFTARKTHYSVLDRRHRLKKVTVFDGGERCRSLSRRPLSRRGSI